MVKSNQVITPVFTTTNPATGAAADATGMPVGTLYVNGVANAATVTVTNLSTGKYKAAVTLPVLVAGDTVSLSIAATVATIAGEGVIFQDIADTKRVSDLVDAAAGLDAAGVRTAVGLVTANLDTQLADLPTNAELTAALAAADDAVLAAIAALNNLSAANVRTAMGLASANLDAQLADLPTNAELGTALSGIVATVDTAAIADAVDVELSASHGSGTWGGATGTGPHSFTPARTETVDHVAIPDAYVWITTDAAGTEFYAGQWTDQDGYVEPFYFMSAGTIYVWRRKAKVIFSNPQTAEVV